MAGLNDITAGHDLKPDRMAILKAFDESKAGVKGLTDSGLKKIPDIFVRPSDELAQESNHKRTQIKVPVIDLSGIFQGPDRRKQIVEQVRVASETLGIFEVHNHGIPLPVLDGMINDIIKFNDMEVEERKKYYSRDNTRRIKYTTSFDLFTSKTASWRDTLTILFPDQIYPEEIPAICRETTVAYLEHVGLLGDTLLSLFSEALGLQPDYLYNLELSKGHCIRSHYYPACPQPELAIGMSKNTEPAAVTILLQNEINGFQFLHQGQWADVKPSPGGLIINIGDLLQLISNGKFKSCVRRVLANVEGPRISVVAFFLGPVTQPKNYGPIKELISEENPAKYKNITLTDYIAKFRSISLDQHILDYYKL